MKIIVIFVLLFLLSTLFSVSMDVIMGMPLQTSLLNLWNPFVVEAGPEIVTTCLIFMIWFITGFISSRNKNK